VSLALRLLPDHLAICRLPADSEVPAWATSGTLRSVSWTSDETSIVCEEAAIPQSVQSERGWRALMVLGPLDFSLTGILLMVARPLADAGVSIFAISTFDTDYVLVKESSLETAIHALVESGHRVE
jgi:uncharacterized protein